ncbi:hypothetical protein [Sphingosinicella sp. BN140058]|uniref:hypothetical protein n=1 Tax=Sphingosinicella sp. BN140058 TaxID=1892855 RepID=UPI001013B73D|nr:hypothetical protein [Sphingosinicella sp. BN140058]QAY80462.1 hypothetical protein ETR14_27885 [Sphingosinicella sp. BN140058]
MVPEIETVNYSGHRFSAFHVRQAPESAPGWFVFGRNSEKYGTNRDGSGAYIMLCARPAVRRRHHPFYNGPVRRGWHRKRDAQLIADTMNAIASVAAFAAAIPALIRA